MDGLASKQGDHGPEEQLQDWELDEHDVGLILWMRGLTPTQRLEAAQRFANDISILRKGREASASNTRATGRSRSFDQQWIKELEEQGD